MKKIFLVLFLALMIGATPCYSANEWRDADDDFQDGDTTYMNEVDTDLSDYVVEPLERLLAKQRRGAIITYVSASALSVSTGGVMLSDTDGDIRKMRENTSATSVTWSDLDVPGEESSKKYYLYAVADADATTFTIKISLSASLPGSVTYYAKLGSFYNNSAGNISYITNYNGESSEELAPYDLSEGTSYSAGTTYQNTTGHKLLIVWYGKTNYSGGWQEMVQYGQIGETSASATVAYCRSVVAVGAASYQYCTNTFVVPEGWYWKITNTGGNVNGTTGTVNRIEVWEI